MPVFPEWSFIWKRHVNASLKCKGEGQGVAATLLISLSPLANVSDCERNHISGYIPGLATAQLEGEAITCLWQHSGQCKRPSAVPSLLQEPRRFSFLHCTADFKGQSYFWSDITKQYFKAFKGGVGWGEDKEMGLLCVHLHLAFLQIHCWSPNFSIHLFGQDPRFLGQNPWVRNSVQVKRQAHLTIGIQSLGNGWPVLGWSTGKARLQVGFQSQQT